MPDRDAPSILLVEDDPDTAGLIRETLRDYFQADCVQHCATMAQAMAVDVGEVDLVLSDINLPDGTGLDILEKFLKRRPDLPVVIVTGQNILDNAMQAIQRGAYDYIVKAGDYLFTIPVVVEKNLAIWRTKQENHQLHEKLTRTLEQVRVKNQQLEEVVTKLETIATTDPLTGLANRRAFGQALQRCFAEAVRYNHDLACVMMDLDEFKQLNDTLGHPAGDDVLRRTARVLEANCRRSDVAARFGGDEFVLLMPQTDRHTARDVAVRVSQEFAAAVQPIFQGSDLCGRVSISMGLACLHHSRPTNGEQLVTHADRALYRAKQAGKTRLCLYHPDMDPTAAHTNPAPPPAPAPIAAAG